MPPDDSRRKAQEGAGEHPQSMLRGPGPRPTPSHAAREAQRERIAPPFPSQANPGVSGGGAPCLGHTQVICPLAKPGHCPGPLKTQEGAL